MKAVILEKQGSIPRWGVYEAPVAQPGEQIVRVKAAAIKQLDRAIVAGTHYSSPSQLPIVCGTDGVGALASGERVYFSTTRRPFGAMAEEAPAALIVPLPAGIDDAAAAAVVNPGLAAWLPLVTRGKMSAGETVLVLGATGASGRIATTAARLLGAGRVIAAGRRQDVLDKLDADLTINLSRPADEIEAAFAQEAERGLDIVVDYIWGPAAQRLLASLTRQNLEAAPRTTNIRFVSVGAMAGPTISLPSAVLRSTRLEILGSGTGNYPPGAEMSKIIADILLHAAAGRLPLNVARYPIDQVAAAWVDTQKDQRPVLLLGGA
jgi:NADPH:quinone reductase-like Zn-dependent oxidoreductase